MKRETDGESNGSRLGRGVGMESGSTGTTPLPLPESIGVGDRSRGSPPWSGDGWGSWVPGLMERGDVEWEVSESSGWYS